MGNNKTGKIIISPKIKNIYPWEMHSAIALTKVGYDVKFIPSHNSIHTADAYLNNTIFEFKSPEGTTIKCIENNIQKALRKQSKCIVIDSVRTKKVRDDSIRNYLISRMRRKRGIKKIIFVNKKSEAIDISDYL